MGLGIWALMDANRVPFPPAKMTACMLKAFGKNINSQSIPLGNDILVWLRSWAKSGNAENTVLALSFSSKCSKIIHGSIVAKGLNLLKM
jgi:hypothetical protein